MIGVNPSINSAIMSYDNPLLDNWDCWASELANHSRHQEVKQLQEEAARDGGQRGEEEVEGREEEVEGAEEAGEAGETGWQDLPWQSWYEPS